ncbi:MAG: PDZ domain-containing protein [Deltaproteobacteria bacterium]|nr:PDZ domain-containing protein [Deltaproteobacteria bacterium]
MNQLPLEPVVAAGRRFLGFRLMQVFDDSPRAHSYGIRPGDIVQSVNGIRLIRPEDLMRIVQKLRKADAIEARILRDGDPRKVRIPIVDDPDLGGSAAPGEVRP